MEDVGSAHSFRNEATQHTSKSSCHSLLMMSCNPLDYVYSGECSQHDVQWYSLSFSSCCHWPHHRKGWIRAHNQQQQLHHAQHEGAHQHFRVQICIPGSGLSSGKVHPHSLSYGKSFLSKRQLHTMMKSARRRLTCHPMSLQAGMCRTGNGLVGSGQCTAGLIHCR